MTIHSVYPSEDSEKAISNYTKQLNAAQREQGIETNPIEYIAGDHVTLKLDDVKAGDVIHIQHEYNLLGLRGIPFLFFYDKLGKRLESKIITTMHNVLSQKDKFNENFIKTFFRKTLYRVQNRIIRKNSDLVIVHADFFKKILVEEYNFPEEKVIVLRQGILENIEITPKEQAKKELGLEGDVFLLIGSLVPDHGADTIIRQAKEIGGTIVIAASDRAINDRNDGRQESWLWHLEELIKVYKADNVRLDIKELPYELWWKYFSAADVVLLPYKGEIGSGIFSDCIATRRPMVTSDIKYFREFQDQKFVEIAKHDYSKAIKKVMSEDVDEDFDRYTKEYGLSNLARKYKEIYNG